MVGKKLDERVKESMVITSCLPCSSQSKSSDAEVRTCSNAVNRVYSALIPNSMRTSSSSRIARAAGTKSRKLRI